MKKRSKPQAHTIVNRRARFDYELGEEFVAGLVLTGPEVRAIRDNLAELRGAFVTIKDNEAWLTNASFTIHARDHGGENKTVDSSPRKLLLSRKQIDQLISAKALGLTIVPLRLLTTGRYIKIVIALAKGKKKHDKRETLKRRDQEREARQSISRVR